MHIPHTISHNIHLFLDSAAVGINSLNLVIYLAAIACEVCSINGKANFAVHIAVNRACQVQADHIQGAAVCVRYSIRVMPRYNIRPRLEVILAYLPNVVRLALYGCEVDGVFALRKRLHVISVASYVRERAAVEVAGGDGCGEVITVINYALRIINLCGVLVRTAVLYMNHIEVANIIERELVSGRNRTNSNRLKTGRTISQLITVYLERFL